MISKNKDGIFQIKELLLPGLIHGFSTKKFGNMSFKFGEKDEVFANQKGFLNLLDINAEVAQPYLDHTTLVKKVDKPGIFPRVDGLITNQVGLPLLITTADCAPILLFDPKNRVIGLVHSGWMGTVGKISLIAIGKMIAEFKCQPENIIVGFGPSIEKCCFVENGAALQENLPEWKDYISVERGDKRRYDLNGFTINQLKEIGIKDDSIFYDSFCTKDHKNDFYCSQLETAGVEKPGRFATVILMA